MSTRTTTTPTRTLRARRLTIAGAVAGVVVAATVGVGAPANAAAQPDGWLRVGHLSPDTKGVDVQLSNLSGGAKVFELDDVEYGQVSPYKELPAGTYVLSMRAADSPDSTPVISTDVTVKAGSPTTVVAYGKNKRLRTTAFADDLTKPGDGQARLRLVQAATNAKEIDVKTSTGTTVAQDARFGTATQYATVDAGKWTLNVSGGGQRGTASVDLGSGTVSTLFVLDNSAGKLTVVPVVDSAATASAPVGGVQTGGGGTAAEGPFTRFEHAVIRFLHGLAH
ncbi:DUF4397 domain-containing protein [Curtobacterium sp. MCBD17_034]|uniref:DUF4397 domain-containing protein n=1 Tax=unclassified Curtobacterium TaxID=257496 RepID=UPI000DA9F85A|nr:MULTISPECIES: DUF4397 domain-containing protein [unclassified Curtobacterium]PZE71633.1 DUF4397 domain-containing protein [Curtobacterium sp. MCBD17_019]PZF57637.1 DUF4397 domain-containing protein [Curtobacterium sp. MCBD17_013]PZF57918.1 DUF4397 domain-containing protein [Curtobacterium sp. MCBD17_034]PZM33429.1 DUF4397 domain-containing protein [Curtobacterium sp. MCBD17_031]WIB66634.1 DUF4397 domain-containing protein [Curtobacterium sp. MCBD17_035]